MGCGKRMRGRPSPSVVDRGILFRRIRELEPLVDIYDVGAMVERLRELYWDYANKKLQPFTHCVQQALDRCQHQHRRQQQQGKHAKDWAGLEDDDVEPAAATPSSRIPKRPRGAAPASPAPSSSTPVSSTSSSSDEEEDAVYEAQVEPEFDLVKSALRVSYSKAGHTPGGGVRGKGETDVQVENAMDGKLKRTVELVGRTAVASTVEAATPGQAGGGEGAELIVAKGKEGPRFRDFGGIKGLLEELMMEVVVPLYHPHLPRMLGVRPMAGILLHGPPGCGKTKLAHAIANETGVPFYKISATEVISGVSGASEENIRELFKRAYRTAPSIVFIDEIDAIGSKRENLQREMERRIVTQLMTCMDESHQALGTVYADSDAESSDRKPGYVLVIGATNRPDAVDPALRRPGRFDRELFLGVPDESARREILSVLTEKLRLDGALDLSKIARATPGFVGADLAALVNKAGNLAMRRIIDRRKSELSREGKDQDIEWWKEPWAPEEIEKLSIWMVDFEEAVKIVQPSLRREGFSSIPNVKWEDVGGLDSLRNEFDRYIIQRVKNPEKYEEFGVTLEAGFLLYGPPGCGKTLIAKAVANEAGANFIHIKGPELLNKYVGESELAVRTIFSRARTCSPCILFFDEIDALTTRRGKDGESVVERLLLQLLIELDGADQRHGVFVIGASNRPEAVDPAVLRPGRLGKVMYVPLPSPDERVLILKALARSKPLAADVDLDLIGRKEECENFSGADLSALVNEAAMTALEEKQRSIDQHIGPSVITTSHFQHALRNVSPSVSEKRRKYYEAMSQNFRAA